MYNTNKSTGYVSMIHGQWDTQKHYSVDIAFIPSNTTHKTYSKIRALKLRSNKGGE